MIDEGTAEEAKSILETVVSSGTGTHAQIGAEGQWGKTGTTENNGDAWFCGGVGDEVTACVWVGYPDSTTPMATLYNGGPVMGGTFPALIWASVISAWEEIKAEHAAEKKARKEGARSGEGGERSTKPKPTCRRRRIRSGAGRRSRSAPEAEEAAPEGEAAPEAGARSHPGSRARIQRRRRRRHRRLGRRSAGPRARDEAAAGGAEAPGALDRFGDADPRAGDDRGRLRPRAPSSRNGSRLRSASLRSRPMPSASVSLPGPEQSSPSGAVAAALRASRSRPAVGSSARISTAAASPSGSADEVEQAVDAVGEVDVGAAGRAEEDLGAVGEADVGVAGGVVALVALGLDDGAADSRRRRAGSRSARGRRRGPSGRRSPLEPLLAPQSARRLQERSSSTRALTAARVSRASSIWAASGTEPVPPAIRFDSSQLLRCSTS